MFSAGGSIRTSAEELDRHPKWISGKKISFLIIPFFISFSSSRELIRLPTREAYNQAVKVKESSWDPKFVDYYKTYVEKDIDMSGWWKAKEIGWKENLSK